MEMKKICKIVSGKFVKQGYQYSIKRAKNRVVKLLNKFQMFFFDFNEKKPRIFVVLCDFSKKIKQYYKIYIKIPLMRLLIEVIRFDTN